MNGLPSAPFVMVYSNINSLPARLSAWQLTVSQLDVSLPSTPLLYAFVESGHAAPVLSEPDWQHSHHPGLPGKKSGGGITLLYHRTCPILALPQHTVAFPADSFPASTAMVWHQVQPNGRSAFLLATVYLHPHAAPKSQFMDCILASLDSVPPLYPDLPVLVVGDFNSRHVAWHQEPHTPGAPLGPASALADWVEDNDYCFRNEPGQHTRVASHEQKDGETRLVSSIIDLVFASTLDLVPSISNNSPLTAALASDHLPLTVNMLLTGSGPGPPPPPSRPRVAWDHRRNAEVWQALLPTALSHALLPLQPGLLSLAADAPLSTPAAQARLDAVYADFERAFDSACRSVVGVRQLHASSRAWFGAPGVKCAYAQMRETAAAYHRHPSLAAHNASVEARRHWQQVSYEAKQQDLTDLCTDIGMRSNAARWQLFKRTTPSAYTPLSSIQHPTTGQLPASQEESLDNLCTAFVAAAQPPPPDDPDGAYAALRSRVDGWAAGRVVAAVAVGATTEGVAAPA